MRLWRYSWLHEGVTDLQKHMLRTFPELRDVPIRHTFATRLLNQSIPIHSLRKLLGHQNINTMQIYARVNDQTLNHQFQKAMSRLEINFFEPQLPGTEQDPVPMAAE